MLDARQRRRFRRDSSAMFGLVLVVLLGLFALVGPWLSGDPLASDFAQERDPAGGPPGPSAAHPLGSDPLFRDVLARLAHGARLSLLIGAGATALCMLIGIGLGVAAGSLAGGRHARWDDALMRLVDVALAFPYLLLVTALGVALDRPGALTVIVILGATSWTGVARVARAKTLQARARDYIAAARALGAGELYIIRRHLLPAIAPSMLVIASQSMAMMILAEAVLSYLTVGIEPPYPTWGRMLHEAESYLGSEPLLLAAPGLAISMAVLGFTRVGDGLSEALQPHAGERPRGQQRFRYAVDVLVVAGALLLVGWSSQNELRAPLPASEPAATPARGGILRLASSGAVHTLDPAVAYDEASHAIDDLIFDTLLSYDHDGRLAPALAESWTLDEGGRRVLLTLRPDLWFHDGAPLEAKDVKRSLERVLHPDTPCPVAHLYRHIEGYADFQARKADHIAGITLLGPRDLGIRLSAPDAGFLSRLTMPFAAPVCPSMGAFDRERPAPLCGAGPFVLEHFEPGERVVLRRFDRYHEPGKPYLDGVAWALGVPPQTQRYRFERGEIDFINELPSIDAFRFARDPRWEGVRHWVAAPVTNSLFMNTAVPPFDNRHVRRAVAFAVDPSVLPQVRVTVVETSRLIPPSIPGPDRSEPMRRHDLARALEEMERAGYPFDPASGRGGWPEPVEYLTIPDTFDQAVAEIVQQQLARIGLRLRLRLVAWTAWLSMISEPGKVAMGWRGWQADHPDPATFFEPILTTAAIQPSGSQNVSFFSNAALDEVVAQAARETDEAARNALWQRAEEIVRDEAPLVPLYGNRELQLTQPRVRGYRPHPVQSMRLRDVWLIGGGS